MITRHKQKKQTSVQLWYPINPNPKRFAHKSHSTDRLIFSDFPERTVTSNFPDVDINVVLQTKKGQQWSRPKDFGKQTNNLNKFERTQVNRKKTEQISTLNRILSF